MDIDIDVSDNTKARELLHCVRASNVENGVLKPHLVGVYFQNIPVDSITGLAAIPYNKAEQYDYHKIDILNLSILSKFESKQQIRDLLKIEPDWRMLLDDSIVPKLFHLAKHGETLKKIKPKSIEELADVLALIRPNKFRLIDSYVRNKEAVRKELYSKIDPSDLRKSHAIPYAQIIVLQLHLLKSKL